MRLIVSMLFAALLSIASSAQAQVSWTVEVTHPDGSPVVQAPIVGEQIVLDITLRSSASVSGIGGAIFGYDSSVITVTGGTLPSHVLAQLATGPGTGFGGLENVVSSVSELTGPISVRTPIFAGVTLAAGGATADGSLDIGFADGAQGGAQFQIIMTAVGAGLIYIEIGTDPASGDVVVLPDGSFGTSQNATITFVPEPGTAWLLGLGLAWLSRAGVSGSRDRRRTASRSV